jgi:hypothetical protein
MRCSPVQIAKRLRRLYRSPDGSATYISVTAEGSELRTYDGDGSRSSHFIGGVCLDCAAGGPCTWPDCSNRNRRGGRIEAGVESASAVDGLASTGLAEVEQLSTGPSPVPEVRPETVRDARTLAFQVRSRGVMHRDRFLGAETILDCAIAQQWVTVDDNQLRPGPVNPEPMTALPDERSSRGWTSRFYR